MSVPFGKAAAIWIMTDIRGGDPDLIVRSLGNWGQGTLLFKYGNGLTKWQGLEEVVAAAREAGFTAAGYWFNYGHADEGRLMADHALDLNLDLVLLDWESDADNRYLADPTRAHRIAGDFKDGAPDVPLALCSWWYPWYHVPDALEDLLKYCDYNMPQVYALENWSNEANADYLDVSIEQYGGMWDGGPERTIPGFAAYDTNTWSPSIMQLRRGSEHAKEIGCPGVWLWSWNTLIGRSGSIDGLRKQERIDEFKSWDWPTVVDPELTCEEKLADCMKFADEKAKEVERLTATLGTKELQIEALTVGLAMCEDRRTDLEHYRSLILASDPGPPGDNV